MSAVTSKSAPPRLPFPLPVTPDLIRGPAWCLAAETEQHVARSGHARTDARQVYKPALYGNAA